MKRTGCIFWLLLITFCSAASSYNVFEENGKVGLKNEDGKILIPAQYQALGWSDSSFSILDQVIGYQLGNLWGLIQLDNRRITEAIYEALLPGDGTLIIARKKSNLSLRMVSGCLSPSGKVVIPFQYDGIKLASFRAVVYTKIGNQYKYGLVDLDNKTLIPQQYKSIHSIGSLRYAVQNFEEKTALFTENGKQVTSFSIDSVSSFKKNYAIIYQNTQQGLMDREGQIKVEAGFREIRIEDDGTLLARHTDEWLFLDGQNRMLQKTRADQVLPLGKNLMRTSTARLIHVKDYDLKAVFPFPLSSLGKITDGKAIYSVNGKYGIARKDGTLLLDASYDSLYADAHFFVGNKKLGGRDNWQLLDSLGRVLSTKTYDQILRYNDTIFPVTSRNYWGAINTMGKETISCTYDSILQQRDGNIVVKFKGQYGIINSQEEWKVTPRPNKLKLISEQRFLEWTLRTTYLKSFDGNAIYFSDNKLEPGSSYLIEYLPSGTLWKIDLNGIIVDRQVEPEGLVERIYPESEGLRAIKKNGQYGFVDSQGRLRIANRYEDVRAFQEGMAAIRIRGHWGFINHDDHIAVQPVYDEVTSFQNGLSLVRQKGLQGLINLEGHQIVPPRYESVTILNTANLLIKQDKLFGLASATGRVLINPKYHFLQDVGNNYVIVARDGKYGVISIAGVSTVPLIYDFIQYDAFNDCFIALVKSAWITLR